MITDINKLLKIGDILNAEGPILGLFQKNKEYILCSYLSDKSGEVYYSTNLEILKKYFKSEINLRQVYLDSDDNIVTRKLRKEIFSHSKADFVAVIQCGDKQYQDISESMKNDKIENQLFGSR